MAADEAAGGRGGWFARHGVRARTTVGACLIVGAALLCGGLLLIAALRSTLTGEITATAQLRAQSLADLIDAGTAPGGLVLVDDEDWLAQVITTDGTVVASSPRLRGRPAVAAFTPGESFVADRLPTSDGCPCQVVVRATRDGRFRVLVAQTLDPVTEGTGAVAAVLAAGIPLLLLMVAVVNWRVVGRALRPVEAIRSQVAQITDAALARRVPRPAGDDEIARLASTMNEMLGRLQAARDRQRRFVSDASHELRSPIATIRHEMEIAAAHPADTDLDRLVADVSAEALRLQHLVDDLLLLARVDEQPARHRHGVDLDDLMLAEARRLRSDARLEVDSTGIGAARVVGDRNQLARMIRNLSDNARRHAASRVTLTLDGGGEAIRLAIGNDGPPIVDGDRDRIFERFTRLDDARVRADGGSGLGLAIVAAIVAAHDGTVRIESSGARTSFVVTLPRAA